eukprot:CFRG5390T1
MIILLSVRAYQAETFKSVHRKVQNMWSNTSQNVRSRKRVSYVRIPILEKTANGKYRTNGTTYIQFKGEIANRQINIPVNPNEAVTCTYRKDLVGKSHITTKKASEFEKYPEAFVGPEVFLKHWRVYRGDENAKGVAVPLVTSKSTSHLGLHKPGTETSSLRRVMTMGARLSFKENRSDIGDNGRRSSSCKKHSKKTSTVSSDGERHTTDSLSHMSSTESAHFRRQRRSPKPSTISNSNSQSSIGTSSTMESYTTQSSHDSACSVSSNGSARSTLFEEVNGYLGPLYNSRSPHTLNELETTKSSMTVNEHGPPTRPLPAVPVCRTVPPAM